MEIIKNEDLKYDDFYEAEKFLHIGDAEEDENYVMFYLHVEDDPLMNSRYYDFEKEKSDKIYHCFDGQDYVWKCTENEVTNDKELIEKIGNDFNRGNYDILRNMEIKYLKDYFFKDKIKLSENLSQLLKKIKNGEKINKKDFRIELKKIGINKVVHEKLKQLNLIKEYDDVVAREIGFEKIKEYLEENNIRKIVFENDEILENEKILEYIKDYAIIEFREYKPIKDFDMIKMTLEEWENQEGIEVEEKDFEEDVPIYRLNGKKINAKIEIRNFDEEKIEKYSLKNVMKILRTRQKIEESNKITIKGVIREGRKFSFWQYRKNGKVTRFKEYDVFGKKYLDRNIENEV